MYPTELDRVSIYFERSDIHKFNRHTVQVTQVGSQPLSVNVWKIIQLALTQLLELIAKSVDSIPTS